MKQNSSQSNFLQIRNFYVQTDKISLQTPKFLSKYYYFPWMNFPNSTIFPLWPYSTKMKSINTKACELVPGSFLPPSNSLRFFTRGSLYETSSLVEVRFATLYRRSSNMSQILKLVCYYVVIRSRTCRHCEISKKLTLNPNLSAKNTPLFSLRHEVLT